jgi:hypothetical protein
VTLPTGRRSTVRTVHPSKENDGVFADTFSSLEFV